MGNQEIQIRFTHNVNIIADKVVPGSLGAVGYDDEGVKTKRWDIIKDGILVNYQATRDQVHMIGQNESHGCSYADNWSSVHSNVCRTFHSRQAKTLTPDEMIRTSRKDLHCWRGVLSLSINNVITSSSVAQMFFEIKNGKIGEQLEDVAYNQYTRVLECLQRSLR